ncbi:MAG: ABC transporter ATP-binding protein [Eubacteriales bacterium]
MFINRALLCLTNGSRAVLSLRISGEIILYGVMLLRALLVSSLINLFLIDVTLFSTEGIPVLVGVTLLIVIEFIINYVNQVISIRTGIRIKSKIREDLLNGILTLGPAYVNKKRSGNLITSFLSKIEAIEPYYTVYLPNGIATIFWAIVVISYLCTINIYVSLTCLVGILIVLLAPNIWGKLMYKFGEEDWSLMSKFQSEMMDNLQGMSTLKVFQMGDTRGKLMETLAWKIHGKTMEQLSVTQVESGVLIVGAYLGSSMSVGVAIWQSLLGNVEVNQLVTVFFLITACFAPAFTLIDTWHLGYHGMTASPSVLELLNDAKDAGIVKQSAQTKSVNNYQGSVEVEFANVSFEYEQEEPVLHNISFSIPQGQKVALVGKSGSGKSTIINLISGFYEPTQGEITVNGAPVDWHDFRTAMGIVWQEPYLFYGTIGDNICFGLENVSKEDMVKAAKMANIHDFIKELPLGYDTLVRERGMRLSGGEKQRIAIARCFLHDPQFLIFDEATSNLDIDNEDIIRESMEQLLEGRTALLIAHRLSTIKNVDQVYVLEKGRINATIHS